METTTRSPTLGMRLDSLIDKIDNLPSTQIYAIFVGITVVICWFLFASSNQPEIPEYTPSPEKPTPRKKHDGPEPRWHFIWWANIVAVVIFAWSVVHFAVNASHYWNMDSNVLLKFLTLWGTLVCYFFGFFGVSFVHDLEDVGGPAVAEKRASSEPVKKVLPPCSSSPVCSDPSSFTKSNKTSIPDNLKELTNEEIAQLVLSNRMKDHELEKRLDCFRAVAVRRLVVNHKLTAVGCADALEKLPYETDLDFSRVHGANCEIVVGYVPIPVGMVGPMTINGESVFIPMATTEGCLIASANRGAKAISQGGGAFAELVRDGITRAPCVRMSSARQAAALAVWCQEPENFTRMKAAFESTTSFGKLTDCKPTVAGKNVYLRLVCFSGDAMGMNMVSKGSLAVIEFLKEEFADLTLVALSGNMCTDKKAASTNWLEGRGKSVVVEATIPKDVVRKTLKTTVAAIVHTNLHKNLIGSAMAGVVGGFNAHASNIVTAVFLATGQDPAQNVESSNCITLLEETEDGDLWMSCTMPSIEVGTVGGGTSLDAQAACLKAIGVKGGGANPGDNARQLAKVVASATLAGELSLLAALAANTLVAAHMQHNRKPTK